MSASNFGAFLTGGASDKVSFDNVMVFVDTDGKETAFEFQDSLAREILDNVDKFSKQFVSDMRRRKKRGKKWLATMQATLKRLQTRKKRKYGYLVSQRWLTMTS